jgi:hypothetical protein
VPLACVGRTHLSLGEVQGGELGWQLVHQELALARELGARPSQARPGEQIITILIPSALNENLAVAPTGLKFRL